MPQLEPHYEIRRAIINYERPGAPVVLNLGIRYKDTANKQVGPPSRVDIELDVPKFTRGSPGSRLTVKENDLLVEAKGKLGTTKVDFVVSQEG